MTQFYRDPADDLDVLFSRLEPAPLPADFAQRVMSRTAGVAQPAPARTGLMLLAYVVALLLLGAAAYEAGRGVSLGGAADLLRMALLDPEAALEAPSEFLLGLAELLPWLELGATALLALAALLAVRAAGRVWALREELGVG